MKSGEQCAFCGRTHPDHQEGCVWGEANLIIDRELAVHRLVSSSPLLKDIVKLFSVLGQRNERDLRDAKYDGIFKAASDAIKIVEGL